MSLRLPRLRQRHQRLRFGERGRQRLVADHVDAGLEEGGGDRRMQMVGRDDDDRLDAVGPGRLGPRHLAVIGIAAVGGEADVGSRRGRVRRVGRQRAGHQRDLVVEPHRQPMHRADEGVAPAADHADPQPIAARIRQTLRRPCSSAPRVQSCCFNVWPSIGRLLRFSKHVSILLVVKILCQAARNGGKTRPDREDRVAKHGVLGISFDHMHMGDLLRQVAEHPDAEIAGIFDPDRKRMETAIATLRHPGGPGFRRPRGLSVEDQGRPRHRLLGDRRACQHRREDRAARAQHHGRKAVRGERRRCAPDDRGHGGHRPQAGGQLAARLVSLAQHRQAADRRRRDRRPDRGAFLRRQSRPAVPSRRQGRGVAARRSKRQKPSSWWYKKASGGGSLLDYLGYGTTLGTWFMNGEEPIEVTSVVDETPGIEVDQHSITVCRYARGLSKFETRWGTLTDPWTQQPQPKCGFVLVGTDGSISSYDYDNFVTLQTRQVTTPAEVPADIAGRPARADRIYARAHRGRRADIRAARSGAQSRRPKDDRQRGAFRREQAVRSARAMRRAAGAPKSWPRPSAARRPRRSGKTLEKARWRQRPGGARLRQAAHL